MLLQAQSYAFASPKGCFYHAKAYTMSDNEQVFANNAEVADFQQDINTPKIRVFANKRFVLQNNASILSHLSSYFKAIFR